MMGCRPDALRLAHQRSALPSGPVTFGDVDAHGHKRSSDEIRIIREFLDGDVDQFLVDSRVDEAAIRALKTQTPEIQWEVIRKGSISYSSNPSASLVGRIRDAKRGVPGGNAMPFGAPGGGPSIHKPNLPVMHNPMQSGGLNVPIPGSTGTMPPASAAPIGNDVLQDAAARAIAKLAAQGPAPG